MGVAGPGVEGALSVAGVTGCERFRAAGRRLRIGGARGLKIGAAGLRAGAECPLIAEPDESLLVASRSFSAVIPFGTVLKSENDSKGVHGGARVTPLSSSSDSESIAHDADTKDMPSSDPLCSGDPASVSKTSDSSDISMGFETTATCLFLASRELTAVRRDLATYH